MSYIPPAPPQPYLPSVYFSVSPRSSINSTATKPEDQQLQLAAANAPLRVIYGRVRIGALIADALVYNRKLILVAVWGEGEIDAVESLQMDDAALPFLVTATHYTGTAGQTVNSTLVAAYAAAGISYTDALPGVAYSVIQVPEGASAGFPAFSAIVRGRKVYDPRTTTTIYSTNPALALADFLSSTTIGLGKTVDWTTVEDVADDCDATVGGAARRIIGLACDNVGSAGNWLDTLRTYAGCFVVQGESGVKLVSDKAGASVHSFTASTIVARSMRLKKRGIQQIPTVMRIEYTDTTATPWRSGYAEVLADGVLSGATPRRESIVSLPGIQRYSQAYREAVERLNKMTLGDLTAEFESFDQALAVEVGDVVDVTHPIGLAAKLMRVSSVSAPSPGRWRIGVAEYDPAMYSDLVQSEPTYADTDLPSPADPPALTGLALAEEVFQLANGTFSSRIRATWDEADYSYLSGYRVEVYQAGALVQTDTVRTAVFASAAMQEGMEYTVNVAAVTSIGVVGAWASASLTAAGKTLIPSDVPSVSTFEVGGTVYVTWTPAVDVDIWRYEVRRGLTTDTWDDATLIDRVDALRLSTNLIPTGTWRLFVKALDSIGQYSTTAAHSDVTVTSDAGAFLVDSYDQTTPTLTNMVAFSRAPSDSSVYYVTEDGVAFGTKYSSTLATYSDVLATYHSSVTSTWLGESDDFGQVLSGQWTGTATVEQLSGTSLISYLGISADGSAWDYLEGLSQRVTSRFSRLKHETLTTGTMLVTVPDQNIRLDAVAREEVGFSTSSASAATLVQLGNNYSAVKRIIMSAEGTAARIATYDRVLVGPEDGLCLYDTSAGGGDSYVSQTISTSARAIVSGDYLEYDVFVFERPGAVGGGVGGMRMRFSDGTFSYSFTLNDALGYAMGNPNIRYGIWQSRKIDLTNVIGKTTSHWMLFRNADTAGDYKAIFRNIRITDGAGTDRLSVWASGEPSVNTTYTSALSSNIQCGPANSFNAYVFDAAGTQVANDFNYVFQGI